MKLRTIGLLTISSCALMTLGCGGSSAKSVAPAIAIVTPTGSGTSTLGTDDQLKLPVTFTTTNFLLMTAESLGCGVGCGHVELLIDGTACNSSPLSYNNEGAASPINALFSSCATATGSHVLTVELHNHDHSPLLNSAGKTVAASVTIKTVTGNDGAASISITSPSAGADEALGVDVNKSVAIEFATENFTLAAPGTSGCGSGCGHVNLLIDGTACNATGSDYNATGSASPINALFGLCPTAAGDHTVTLELHNDDDSLVSGAAPAMVAFTTH